MNFRAGQKVLCVNDHYTSYCAYPLKKGSVYTIDGFYRCSCGSSQVTLMEIPEVTNMGCRCHLTSVRRQSYFTWRFIPLEYFEKLIDVSQDKKEVPVEIDVEEMKQQKEAVSISTTGEISTARVVNHLIYGKNILQK